MSAARPLACFAIAAPGLEPLVARELAAMGIAPEVEEGGVAFQGTLESVARANLWLRTASRVVVRLASFPARTFHELERHARRVEWARALAGPDVPVAFRVTSKKSKLYHTGAIAQRLGDALAERLGRAPVLRQSREAEEEGDGAAEAREQLFVVRVARDVVTVSADSSGPLLHFRGYRQALAKAPLRETLAAALLLGSGWDGTRPLLDPLCGSGTIPIEGALLARHLAPGRGRRFACMGWPGWSDALWARLLAEADERALPRSPVPIRGSDRDAGAIAASRANAERAGVAADIDFDVRPLSAVERFGDGRGSIVSNPPYGVRVGEAARLRDLYAQLGNVGRRRFPGWTIALLSANERLEAQVGLPLQERFRTRNGGIPVRLVAADIAPG